MYSLMYRDKCSMYMNWPKMFYKNLPYLFLNDSSHCWSLPICFKKLWCYFLLVEAYELIGFVNIWINFHNPAVMLLEYESERTGLLKLVLNAQHDAAYWWVYELQTSAVTEGLKNCRLCQVSCSDSHRGRGVLQRQDTCFFENKRERKTIDMANKVPEPLPLLLAELTASQFLDIWNKFDADGECNVSGRKASLV